MDDQALEARVDRLRSSVVGPNSQRVYRSSQILYIFYLLHQQDDIIITRSFRAKFNRILGGENNIMTLRTDIPTLQDEITAAEMSDIRNEVQRLTSVLKPLKERHDKLEKKIKDFISRSLVNSPADPPLHFDRITAKGFVK